ncbi:MAG: hypothetical protein WAQ71_01685 [Limnochordia bacterium]
MLYRGGKRKNSILDIHDQTAEMRPVRFGDKTDVPARFWFERQGLAGKNFYLLNHSQYIYILAEVLPDPGPQITGAVHKLTD